MKRKWIAVFLVFVMAASLAACGGGEETTLTGMVVSVDGTVLSLMEMDGNMGGDGERPEGGFGNFGNFNPEDFDGTMPTGEGAFQWGSGEMPEMPEGATMPEGMTIPESGERPDFSGQMPEDMTLPEGMTMPENGEMPSFGGMGGFENFEYEGETTQVDIGDAHISVEIDGGKASGSLSDITAGSMVTITKDGKGNVTNVLVSSRSSFGGRGQQ